MGHREALLAGARQCIVERGYARTTARDLVAASGTNLGSIGYHFGTKEALLTAAIVEGLEEWGERFEGILVGGGALREAGQTPLERFEAMWSRVVDSFVENRALLLASFEAFIAAERNPELRALLTSAYQEARSGLAAMVLGQPEDDLDEGAIRSVGSLNLALMTGVIAQWLLDPDRSPSGADLADGLRAIAGSSRPAAR